MLLGELLGGPAGGLLTTVISCVTGSREIQRRPFDLAEIIHDLRKGGFRGVPWVMAYHDSSIPLSLVFPIF